MESIKNDSRYLIQKKNSKKKLKRDTDISNFDKYLFHEGRHFRAYEFMGSHKIKVGGIWGYRFITWAPKATEVYVVGDFSNFQISRKYKMKKVSTLGLWEKFIPYINENQKYKYAVLREGEKDFVYKTDPYGRVFEVRPNNAAITKSRDKYIWRDSEWLLKRRDGNILKKPLNIYEIHLGSWKCNNGLFKTYRELAKELPEYIKEMGYTHVEIMPVMEHPLDKSWGYQANGYYSPTSRFGNDSDFKMLINNLHKNDIGVILDWVPGHFCKNEDGLYKFDGHPTYEYEEDWKSNNIGWGTCNFDLGRPEVRSFLISNALFWLREFHIDGLRVDAVSNMIYLNYGREEGEWRVNKYGGDGCLEGIDFLKELNTAIFSEFKNIIMSAEESTAWPNITKSVEEGGLGFNFKWNMGWMNDTLKYIEIDPIYRKYKHNNLTFSMMYNYSEKFILPISHDEVVHGKKSLVNKMWGDYWNKFSGLRLYASFMMGHPGKKLMFMGTEFAQFIEWKEYEELEWELIDKFPMHKATQEYFKDMNKFYKGNRALWELDYKSEGFKWIDADNMDQSIVVFMRKSTLEDETLIFICNFTPVVYYQYKIGVPFLGEYEEVFNTDNSKYGGSGQVIEDKLNSINSSYHTEKYSLEIKVPPMATLILKPKNIYKEV